MANTKITTAVIKDDAITTAKIADDAVTGALIADDVALAGNPTTTTQSAGNNTTRIATTAFVTTAINNLVDSAPSALDTLNELAAAMGDDANFSTTVTNSIATKAALAGATFTGDSGLTKESPAFTLTDSSSSRTLLHFVDDNNSVVRASGPLLIQSGGAVSAITLDASQNATFSGDIIANKNLRLRTTDDQANQWYFYTYTDDTLRINYNGAGADALIFDTSENATFSNDVSFGTHGRLKTSGGYFSVETTTSDGSDNNSVALDAGGGGGSSGRGAFLGVYGNEHGSYAGQVYAQTGSAGKFDFATGASQAEARLTLTSTELTVRGPSGNSAAGVIDIQGRNHSGFGSTVNARSRVASRTAGSSNAYHSELVFYTTNTSNVLTERGHFDQAGDFHLNDGNLVVATTHGIDFTNSGTSGASTDTQLLDDYEKGTWTMFFDTTGTGFASSANSFTGQFVKVGRIITAYAYTGAFNITAAGTGSARIRGFPFNSASSSTAYAAIQIYHTTALTNNSVMGYMQQGNNFAYPTPTGTVGADTWKVANGVYVMIQATYVTA